MVILISIATFFSTLLGGLFALRLKDRLHLILGFSAGAMIGVAFFDLIPEALEIGSKDHSPSFITTVMAVGFLIYLFLDRLVLLHGHHEEKEHLRRGRLGAGSLSLHSFLDGVSIGLAFKVSSVLGAVVAVAVLTHDFSDGINTVNLVLKNKGERSSALRWLFVDAFSPVVGVVSTLFFTIQEGTLGLLLALFSGFFLYIGASDLLPESHHAHPVKWTTVMTVVGMGVLFVATRLAGG
jgi:zinc transporter ZupT